MNFETQTVMENKGSISDSNWNVNKCLDDKNLKKGGDTFWINHKFCRLINDSVMFILSLFVIVVIKEISHGTEI